MGTRVRWALVAASTVALAVPLTTNAVAEDPVTAKVPMRWTAEGAELGYEPGSVVARSSQRTAATADGASMVVTTNGLRRGHAYTLWFTFFDHPEFCVDRPNEHLRCGLGDLLNPAAGASLVYGDGIVAKGRRDVFSGYRPVLEGFSPTEHRDKVAWGTGVLTNPLGAEYQATLRGHGPYDPQTYGDAQLTTLDGGCHLGEKYTCVDDQASGFRAQAG